MINIEEFIKRLQIIIAFYSLSAASFADKINVQRSSISHILSGRNKPSLEFVMKVLSSFPEIDLYWLLYGKGHFPAQKSIGSKKIEDNIIVDSGKPDEDIDRIIIFYKDGSFKNYNN